MSVKVAINGFGRIGRNVFRAAVESGSELEFVAVNDLTDSPTLAHLLKYDSVYGIFGGTVEAQGDSITVDGRTVQVFSERDPAAIDWESVGAQVVIESTGHFSARQDAAKHLGGPVQKVIISAPAKEPDVTLALGVNQESYDPANHHVLSNASCTTNCLAPVAKVLNDRFGIEHGLMTTIHSFTNDQRILDLPHKDLRRARAASVSMIPTTTGAAKAVTLVLPELTGRLDGISIRVPTPTVSLVDLTATLQKSVTGKDLRSAFQEEAEGALKGILDYSEEPLVSIDYSKNPHSAVVDGPFVKVLGDSMVKILAWYDNEWGYSSRVLQLTEFIGQQL